MTVRPVRRAPRSRMARAVCPTCEREVAVGVPSLGDSSVDVYRNHDVHPGGARCDNSRMRVRPAEYVKGSP